MKSAGLLFMALLLMPVLAFAQADSCTMVATGTNQNITAHGECRNVAFAGFGGAAGVCAPTNTTLAEWQSFYNNPPAGVTITACSGSCAGYSYGGYCYFHAGATNSSCDTVCASQGGCSLAGTRYIGSDDPGATRCSAVATALSGTAVTAGASTGDTYGCWMINIKGGWGATNTYSPTTTCTNANATGRICACGTGGGGGTVNGVCNPSGGCTSGTYQFDHSENHSCPGPFYGTVNFYNCLGSGGGTSEYNCNDGWGQTCCGSLPC